MIKPDSSPLAKYVPSGLVAKLIIELEWPINEILSEVGKGLRVDESGSLGMSESGSMFSFFFLTLGHK